MASESETKFGSLSEPMETSTGGSGSALGKRTRETRDAKNVGESKDDTEVEEGLSSSEEEETEVMETQVGEVGEVDDSDWEKDSYDGLEYHSSDSDNKKLKPPERRYRRLRIETKGFFDAAHAPPGYFFGGMVGVKLDQDPQPEVFNTREFVADIATQCVKKYNDRKGKNVKFVSVLRANFKGGSITTHYITFKAKESNSPDAPDVVYQAKAITTPRQTYPIFCRPSLLE